MKVLLWSKDHPKLKSGYGIAGSNLGPGLEGNGHEVVYYCSVGHRGYVDYFEGIPVLPGNGDAFDEDALRQHYEKLEPDVLVSWCDLTPLQKVPKYFGEKSTRHWVAYAPVDYVDLPEHFLKRAECPDVFVPFCWEAHDRLVETYGLENVVEPIYHGLNTDLWRPLDTFQYPKAMSSLGFTESGFNVLIDAANQYSRKAWHEAIEGLAMFREETDLDVNLYIHSHAHVQNGWHLPKLVEKYGLDDTTVIADNYHKAYGLFSEEEMVLMYNCADVALMPGMEGFGWGHIQAQACRTPVVALQAGPAPELVKAGVLVPPKDFEMTPDLLQRPVPNQQGIAAALEAVAESSSSWEKGERWVREEGPFDWERDVIPAWRELLRGFEEDVDERCAWGPPEPCRELRERGGDIVEVS